MSPMPTSPTVMRSDRVALVFPRRREISSRPGVIKIARAPGIRMAMTKAVGSL